MPKYYGPKVGYKILRYYDLLPITQPEADEFERRWAEMVERCNGDYTEAARRLYVNELPNVFQEQVRSTLVMMRSQKFSSAKNRKKEIKNLERLLAETDLGQVVARELLS